MGVGDGSWRLTACSLDKAWRIDLFIILISFASVILTYMQAMCFLC